MSHRSVLVVDDDRSSSNLVAKLLSDRGYQVDVARDGASALGLLSRKTYALVVLDYQMPGMNGVEVFEKAKEMRPELIGVLLTAYTGIGTVFPALGVGLERVLAKPVDAGELVPLVGQLIGAGS